MTTTRLAIRTLLALAFVAALTIVPATRVAACTCAMGEPDASIRGAPLAFIGTVVDERDTGAVREFGGASIEYAFAVERASRATDPVTRVLAGGSGSSCGMTFTRGEEWLVVFSPDSFDGSDTHLCAGNMRLADMGAAERASIAALLPVIPVPAEEAEPAGPPMPIIVGSLAVALIVLAAFLAFRPQRIR